MKGQLVDILGTTPDKVHVRVGNVGGSFGMKAAVYPEYVPIIHAAKELGRPVKWTADRFESFVSDHHGRDHEFTGELALDEKGKFLAARFTGYGNTGAYLGPVSPLMSTLEHREERGQRLQNPADRGVNQGHLHQHGAGVGLSRRGPSRGQLLHGAADRPRRGRDEDRPLPAAQAQPDPQERDSLQGLVRHAVRLRRFPGAVRARGRDRRREGLQAAQARVEEARQAARARARQLSGSHRAAEQGNGRHPLREERRRDDDLRHARLRPGPRRAVRAGADREARHSVRAHSSCCRATATNCSRAAAPAARARCMRAAPRSSKAPIR